MDRIDLPGPAENTSRAFVIIDCSTAHNWAGIGFNRRFVRRDTPGFAGLHLVVAPIK